MPKEMLMPAMAESIVEVEILKWLVKEGDDVKEGQMVAEVMTDKVTTEIPAPFSGKLEKILAKEGSVVGARAPIAVFAGEGDAAAAAPVETTAPSKTESKLGADDQSATASATNSMFGVNTKEAKLDFGGLKKSGGSSTAVAASTNKFGRPLAVPAARALAREHDVDIATVPGSGPNGRVGMDDMRGFLAGGSATPAATQSTSAKAAPSSIGGLNVTAPVYKTPKGYEHLETRMPLRGLRRAISNAMQASHLYTVRTLTIDEVDMTALVALRTRLKPAAEKAGIKLTYLPFIFKAATTALKAFPNLNSSFDEATQEIVHKQYYNLGCAVDTEAGLIVPVVKDVDRKSITEIAREISDLAGKTREGKASPESLSGSSFSVTNMGSAGSLLSFPIINVPDAAILGVQTIQERAVVREGQIVIRSMMYLSLSFDHRLVDGAEAARFLRHISNLLESPDLLLLEAI
jgi:2-oxoisovalerate dehydrogenase E2 component (dihydrolipoyl transacylase)